MVSGAVASLAAAGFVWGLERALGIPDPNHFRLLLAALVSGIVGIFGKVFLDEIARN